MPDIKYNSDRQAVILNLLAQQWKEHPKMRLGQLLVNIADRDGIFYIEDNSLKKRLSEYKF
jgi:uncharacterized protein YihD (DUF1040 family)